MRTLGYFWQLWTDGGLPCLFHEITGLYCPGCGGTRAVKALLTGRPVLSLFYHPLVLYCAVLILWLAVSYLFYFWTKNPKYRRYLELKYIYIGIGITAVNFLVKNYFLVGMGMDILEMLPKV